MLKVILFSALLSSAWATSYPLTYEETGQEDYGLIDEDEVRTHYMKPIYQTQVEYNDESEGPDLFMDEEIKHKKQSYEATKVTQEEVEIKSVNNNYGGRLPHHEYKEPPKTYKKEKHAPKPVEEKQELVEPGDYSGSIGEKNDLPRSSEGHGNKNYHQPTSASAGPIQEHVEADFKGPHVKNGISKPSSHTPTQQVVYEAGIRPKHYGHEGGYKGYSNYKPKEAYKSIMMDFKPNSNTPSSPQSYGIYREGPKKYPSTSHGSAGPSTYQRPQNTPHHSGGASYHYGGHSGNSGIGGAISSHHSLEGIGNKYQGHSGTYGGSKSSGIKSNGASSHGSHYKGNGGFSGLHNLGGGSNLGHYNHKHAPISGSAHPGHYHQPKHSGSSGYKQHTYHHGSDYHHGIGGHRNPASGLGGSSIKSSSEHHRQHGGANTGNNGHRGKQYTSSNNQYSGPVANYHYTQHTKNDGYQPKHIKSTGIKYPHAGGSSSGGSLRYPQPKPHQNNHNGNYHSPGLSSSPLSSGSIKGKPSGSSGIHHSAKRSVKSKPSGSSGVHHTAKSYPQPKISQEMHIDDSKSIGESNGQNSPSYHKSHPAPSKPHYQPKYETKPSYESPKGGYQSPKEPMEYHGIGESNAEPPAPTPSKGHSNKGGLERHGIKGGSSSSGPSHGEKKYLPVTASHSNGGSKDSSHEQPLKETSSKYEPPKTEQKDIGYEALLGGHGSQSPGSASGGYGSSSSGSSSPSDESSSHEVYGSDDKHEMSKPMPYEFKYEIKDDEHGADQYREEKMDDNGYLTGRYGYKDAHGLYRQVEYEASKDGFKVSNIKTNEPGTDNKDPADVHFEVEKNSQHYN
ncbi:cuticle protein 16.8 [Trichonephila inaurata madagascariensis]|uniref:Cuticle protein 16.8 n=1 Tax=Trichonephila inaurata madagascariensis TaxID=2747483 RepID=A0A8X6XRT9_9ARAC|nr:cuticle protein 16.8 [Trichonephila inaurata madagascariensis]